MRLPATAFFTLATSALAIPLSLTPRADIPHSAFIGFPESVPNTTKGALMLEYQPYLKIIHGSVSFLAVDSDGNTSVDLGPTTGTPSNNCSHSTGQVYCHTRWHQGRFEILYSWYMPKDIPKTWGSILGRRYRHDREDVIVWLSDNTGNATLLGAAASAPRGHGTMIESKMCVDHPLIQYYGQQINGWRFARLDHSMDFAEKYQKGEMQPLFAWESLTEKARQALSEKDWGFRLSLYFLLMTIVEIQY